MKKNIFFPMVLVQGILLILTFLLSCQQIFTYSPLSWAQRDPSNLPPDQKIAYAEGILSSGDTAAIAKAYDIINELVSGDPTNVDLQLLAADLALGGSGINDALEDLDPTNMDENAIEELLSDINLDLVAAAADHVVAAEDAETNAGITDSAITQEQYLNTGLILLAQAAGPSPDGAGDFSSLSTINSGDDGWDTLVEADRFITLGGGSINDYGVSNPNL